MILLGCLYQGLCQTFGSSWKDFRGATLKCEEDKNVDKTSER